MSDLPEQFLDSSFWVWADSIKHWTLYLQTKGNCCFNHIITLSQNGNEYPLFDYENYLIDAVSQNVWIKNPR